MDIGNGFGNGDRQRYLRIALIAGVALVVLLLVLIVVAIVRGRSASGTATETPVTRTVVKSPIVASPVTTVRPTIPVALPSVSSAPASAPATSAAPSSAAPAASASGRSFVVANTSGEGVKLRSEPATTAQEIVVLPDGQRLKEIGASRNAGGRDWYNVEDEKGNKGWVAAEFTAPAP